MGYRMIPIKIQQQSHRIVWIKLKLKTIRCFSCFCVAVGAILNMQRFLSSPLSRKQMTLSQKRGQTISLKAQQGGVYCGCVWRRMTPTNKHSIEHSTLNHMFMIHSYCVSDIKSLATIALHVWCHSYFIDQSYLNSMNSVEENKKR